MTNRTLKALLLVVSLPMLGNALAADDSSLCRESEVTVWSCKVKKKTYSVCASRDLTGEKGYMQYRAGSSERTSFRYPGQLLHPKGHFEYSLGAHGAGLTFKNGEYTYHIGDELRGNPVLFVDRSGGDSTSVECTQAFQSLTENSAIELMEAAGISK